MLTSLLRKYVNYGQKSFITLAPGAFDTDKCSTPSSIICEKSWNLPEWSTLRDHRESLGNLQYWHYFTKHCVK